MTAQEAKTKTCEYLNGAGNGGNQLEDVLDAIDAQTGMGHFEMKYWFVDVPLRQTCKQLVELGYSVLCNWDYMYIGWGRHTTPRKWCSHDDADYNKYYIKT